MAKRLKDSLNSGYVKAANSLSSKRARRRIVAYVESYDDVLFWRTVLSRFEDERRYFEVMLPSHDVLTRGKKSVLMNFIGDRVGPDMLACVDADYDYLLQGVTETSRKILSSPYVFHTYTYAIENYHCYAPALHNVCVMATLNDHAIFDFEEYLRLFSTALFPLFVWSIWMYRTGRHTEFSLSDFNRIADPGGFNMSDPLPSIEGLRRKAQRKVAHLQRHHPEAKASWLKLKAELLQLGVTPETTYLFIQGHHVFDVVVAPIMTKVCNRLRTERENEINRTAVHQTQRRNEISCYEGSLMDIKQTMKKSMGYALCPLFRRIQDDIANYLDHRDDNDKA